MLRQLYLCPLLPLLASDLGLRLRFSIYCSSLLLTARYADHRVREKRIWSGGLGRRSAVQANMLTRTLCFRNTETIYKEG